MKKFLSPSCIGSYFRDWDGWYDRYILRMPSEPQSPAMGLGSAFDAFVKWGIVERLGKGRCEFPYDSLEECYEDQVAKHLDIEAVAKEIYDDYVDKGMMRRLFNRRRDGKLVHAKMECLTLADVKLSDGTVVTIGGYPDAILTYENGKRYILDWKINGYFSKRRVGIGKGAVFVCGNCTGREKIKRKTDFSDTAWNTQLTIYSICEDVDNAIIHQAAFAESKALSSDELPSKAVLDNKPLSEDKTTNKNVIDRTARWAEFEGSVEDKTDTMNKIEIVSKALVEEKDARGQFKKSEFNIGLE